MFLLQPISQSTDWQVESSPQVPSVVKGQTGVFGQGVHWKSVFHSGSGAALRHLVENWGAGMVLGARWRGEGSSVVGECR